MSVLPQLERDLLDAANRRRADDRGEERSDSPPRVNSRLRRLRLPVLALSCLLAVATIALAAGGVILTGAPVHPEELPNPDVGEGVPAPGASRLLPLRVPDPEGGLPWGMRIVRTTRGEVCLQIGRVQDGQLGELGIDGAFHDDGRFHPIPADALPADVFHGHVFGARIGFANANTSCELAGEASANYRMGVDRSAAAGANGSASPLRDLRDIYDGLLGPDAVDVSYRAGAREQTVAVVPRIGVYLIVRAAAPGQQLGTGGGSLGTEGDLPPSPPLAAITYRLDNRLCQRGPSMPPGTTEHLADPCPFPHSPTSPVHAEDLHQPLRVRLHIGRHAIADAEVSFTAPLAVTSAREEYVIAVPNTPCPGASSRGYGLALESLGRDVRRGALVTSRIGYPFANGCGARTATIEVLYERTGAPSVLVGSTVVHAPAGARLSPPVGRPRRRRRAP